MTLGELIDALEKAPASALVRVDTGHASTRFASYRGYYSELALAWGTGEPVTVQALLDAARDANGATFEGYKGGEFTMRLGTDLYVAGWGEWPGRALVGVIASGDGVVLVTHEAQGW